MAGELAEIDRKRRALQAQFATLPETIVVGAVGAGGPAGVRTPPERQWYLHLRLVAWRELGQPLRATPLTVTKLVTHDELATLRDRIEEHSSVAFRAKLAINSPFGDARAELLSLLAGHQDAELSDFLATYAKPVRIVDPQFGTFELDKAADWFEADAQWCGTPIRLTICRDASNSPEAALRAARQIWGTMAAWEEKVTAHAVMQLLDVKNDNWRATGERKVTADRFIAALRLESIVVRADGRFDFWYDDGNLFLGHAINVSGSLDEGLTEVRIAG